jgi:predicted GNAT family acetyltransferase
MVVSVTENKDASRFEARVEGELAGILDYRLAGSVATMPHTQVEPRFEGRGIGSALVRCAVDTARQRHWQIVPACWFVAAWIDRHPDAAELLKRSA